MAKYSKAAQKKVETAMHEMHEGKLKSGGSGKKVTNPKQAIAIGLSEARAEGKKVPKKSSNSSDSSGEKKSSTSKSSSSKSSSKNSGTSKAKSTSTKTSDKSETAKKSTTKKS